MDHAYFQLVRSPTQLNVLNLFITNYPSLIKSVDVNSSISHHDIGMINSTCTVKLSTLNRPLDLFYCIVELTGMLIADLEYIQPDFIDIDIQYSDAEDLWGRFYNKYRTFCC